MFTLPPIIGGYEFSHRGVILVTGVRLGAVVLPISARDRDSFSGDVSRLRAATFDFEHI